MIYPVRDWDKWYDAQSFGSSTNYGFHEAADLNLKTGGDTDLGQDILAIADGVVTSVHNHTTSNNFGKHTHIKHEGPWGTVWCHFAHCSEVLVSEGQEVKEGQVVARVGKSGTVYSHLHWAIKLEPTGIDGFAKTLEDLKKWTNPIKFVEKWMLVPSGDPLKFTQKEYDLVRAARDENWNLYQETLTKLGTCQGNLGDAQKQLLESEVKYDRMVATLSEELQTKEDSLVDLRKELEKVNANCQIPLPSKDVEDRPADAEHAALDLTTVESWTLINELIGRLWKN